MKPEASQIVEAAERLAALSMYPSDQGARKEIMRLLARMVPTVEALNWLIDTMIDQVGDWRGPVHLRSVLCARFAPLDGKQARRDDTKFLEPPRPPARRQIAEPERAQPAGREVPVTDEERAEWAALNEKIKQRAEDRKLTAGPKNYRIPKYLQ